MNMTNLVRITIEAKPHHSINPKVYGLVRESKRPILKNEYWSSFLYKFLPRKEGQFRPIVPNQFGTDEYCTLCEQLGINPYIGINYGSGTPEEAADWVEYLNGDANTN